MNQKGFSLITVMIAMGVSTFFAVTFMQWNTSMGRGMEQRQQVSDAESRLEKIVTKQVCDMNFGINTSHDNLEIKPHEIPIGTSEEIYTFYTFANNVPAIGLAKGELFFGTSWIVDSILLEDNISSGQLSGMLTLSVWLKQSQQVGMGQQPLKKISTVFHYILDGVDGHILTCEGAELGNLTPPETPEVDRCHVVSVRLQAGVFTTSFLHSFPEDGSTPLTYSDVAQAPQMWPDDVGEDRDFSVSCQPGYKRTMCLFTNADSGNDFRESYLTENGCRFRKASSAGSVNLLGEIECC